MLILRSWSFHHDVSPRPNLSNLEFCSFCCCCSLPLQVAMNCFSLQLVFNGFSIDLLYFIVGFMLFRMKPLLNIGCCWVKLTTLLSLSSYHSQTCSSTSWRSLQVTDTNSGFEEFGLNSCMVVRRILGSRLWRDLLALILLDICSVSWQWSCNPLQQMSNVFELFNQCTSRPSLKRVCSLCARGRVLLDDGSWVVWTKHTFFCCFLHWLWTVFSRRLA